jgi:RND family efflux transporter MFP subunit
MALTLSARAAREEPPQTVEVRRGLLKVVVRVEGHVGANREVGVQPSVPGQVVAVPIKIGQAVKRGQVLVELDRSPYERELRKAKAAYAESQAYLDLARLEYEEVRRAMGAREVEPWQSDEEGMHSAYSTRTLQMRQLLVERWEAATSQTLFAVGEAQARLAATRLESPLDGVVTEIDISPGERISDIRSRQGSPVVQVADLSKIVVETEIDQEMIRDIQLNLAASVTLPAFPERTFPGRIAMIAPKAVVQGNNVQFPVRIELEGEPGDAAKPGLSANCEIVAIEKPDVLLLDNRAIQRAGSEAAVIVLETEKMREQRVKLGRTDGRVTEVVDGLQEGDKVVLPDRK